MLKGYFERVWNYGLAYGQGSRLKEKRIRFFALIGGTESDFVEHS
ncbi:hypothetical protein DKK76_04890 [Frischella perrara]|uniref:Flavodoxin-like fold domain-containing protein n=1 Tax=Frischella perrara TaxID=1267021 RepID=A0A318MRX5_FRIPE|nr:hypothetical protein DKK76_04890 [Frischella perrara]